MKILVFSDSHRNIRYISKALSEHGETAEFIVHLGDEADDLPLAMASLSLNIPCITVSGNCDKAFSQSSAESILELANTRILCTHGHRYFVKNNLDILTEKASAENIDLVLFGHTHRPLDTTAETESSKIIRIFNPGSVGKGNPPSYGIINILNGTIVSSHRFFTDI